MNKSEIVFYYSWCKQCYICVNFCSCKCIKIDEDGYPYLVGKNICNRCRLCEKLCPDYVIEVIGLN
ncbi:MAG: 4Fe-4S dicluster domain-containing protein [Atribacterota bacterium]